MKLTELKTVKKLNEKAVKMISGGNSIELESNSRDVESTSNDSLKHD